MDNNQEKSKKSFANAFKKAGDLGKKAVEETKKIAVQTKENIHEQKAKKYTAITLENLQEETFKIPTIIKIEDDSANREFIEDENAIGWIETHKDVPALHIYFSFVEKSGLTFVAVPQRDNVYCQDNFDHKKFINSNQVFGKATEEKLAELSNIAYCLGAKSCSVEFIESESQVEKRKMAMKAKGSASVSASMSNSNSVSNKQSGKRVSYFEGHDDPKVPKLKWFAHDDNIKGLIEMRCNKAIKSTVLELKGFSSATMSKTIACAIDNIMNIGGKMSMEKEAIKEYDKCLLFEIDF